MLSTKYGLVTDGHYWSVKRTRRFFFIFKIVDFYSCTGYFWEKDHPCFKFCWEPKERAERLFKRLTA